MTDPITDYLLRIKNAIKANHRIVEIPLSNLKKEMSRILKEQGYIQDFKGEENPAPGSLKIALKYSATKQSPIRQMTRASRPGLRKYAGKNNLPRVLNGLGIAILTTSKGLM